MMEQGQAEACLRLPLLNCTGAWQQEEVWRNTGAECLMTAWNLLFGGLTSSYNMRARGMSQQIIWWYWVYCDFHFALFGSVNNEADFLRDKSCGKFPVMKPAERSKVNTSCNRTRCLRSWRTLQTSVTKFPRKLHPEVSFSIVLLEV